MCTTNEWREFNKDRSRKSLRDKVSNLILTDRFWKKAGEVQTIMEPLVKVLKLVDQDKKPTLSIIYEAMNRAKLVIKASVKQWEKDWEVIDSGGKVNCTNICMLQVIKKFLYIFLLFFIIFFKYKLLSTDHYLTYDNIFFKPNVPIFKAFLQPSGN